MSGQLLRKGSLLLALGLILILTFGGVANAQGRADRMPGRDVEAEPGVLMVSVVAGSPAAKAGMVRGDIVLTVEDEEVNFAPELVTAIQEREVGDEIVVSVLHGDDVLDLDVVLGERQGRTYLGVLPYYDEPTIVIQEPEEETEEGGAEEEAAPDQDTEEEPQAEREAAPIPMFGAMVVELVEDGPAAEAGLAEGDLIVAVDDVNLDMENNLADLIAAYEPGDEIVLTVLRDDEEMAVAVTLGSHPDDDELPFLGVRFMPMFSGMRGQGFEGRSGMPNAMPHRGGELMPHDFFFGPKGDDTPGFQFRGDPEELEELFREFMEQHGQQLPEDFQFDMPHFHFDQPETQPEPESGI